MDESYDIMTVEKLLTELRSFQAKSIVLGDFKTHRPQYISFPSERKEVVC